MVKEVESSFIWDPQKEAESIKKHGIDFKTAINVFRDPQRKIIIDSKHSEQEGRFFCIGKLGERIITVRFSIRAEKVRIIGAGYWRKGVKYYE